MGEERPTLTNRLREGLALHPENFLRFYEALSPADRQEIREMIVLGEELRLRGLTPLFKVSHRSELPNFKDPVDELKVEFSDLIFRAQSRLTTHGREQVFGGWMDILTQKLRSRKDAVVLRWFLNGSTMSKREFTRMIAKENEAFPPKERVGWSGTNPDDIKRLLNDELKKLREQEDPPHLSVIEGGRKTP